MRSKRNKYKAIIKDSVEGYCKGFKHRSHRTKITPTGKRKPINKKNNLDYFKDRINIFGDIDNI